MNAGKVKLGIAPIGWSNDDMPELGGHIAFEQCVSEMALAGYEGCEVGRKFPKGPEVLLPALNLRHLRICNAWFSAYLTTRPLEQNISAFRAHCGFLNVVGAKVVGISEQGGSIQGDKSMPVFERKPVFGQTEWDLLFDGVRALSACAAEYGIALTYHHHMGTGVQTTEETRRLLDGTDPTDLGLLYDTGHFALSGEDPAAALEEFLPRVKHVHLKDVRADVAVRVRNNGMSFLDAVRAGVFTVPGDGSIDFRPIFDQLDRAGYTGWMVVEAEQDPAKANPLEYAIKGRRYISQNTGL
jgi:inosose dehydratase